LGLVLGYSRNVLPVQQLKPTAKQEVQRLNLQEQS